MKTLSPQSRRLIFVFLGIVLVLAMAALRQYCFSEQQVRISGIVVPHHGLVAAQRAKLFSELKGKVQPSTIILVSPNHYSYGTGNIQTTDKLWDTAVGKIEPDKEVVARLVASGLAVRGETVFDHEHGIYNILKDIYNTFPEAKLVPLVLKTLTLEEVKQLSSVLAESCKNCLMVASVDFSHYQPELLADLHDQKTLREITNLNTPALLTEVEVDSGSSLTLLALWAKQHNTLQFKLHSQTNSNAILGQPYIAGTSHVYGWYQSGKPPKPEEFVSFVYTPKLPLGEENRSIWGTDHVFVQPFPQSGSMHDYVVAGKLSASALEFFVLPIDPATPTYLATRDLTATVGKEFYDKFVGHVTETPAGKVVSLPGATGTDLRELPAEQLGRIIEEIIANNTHGAN